MEEQLERIFPALVLICFLVLVAIVAGGVYVWRRLQRANAADAKATEAKTDADIDAQAAADVQAIEDKAAANGKRSAVDRANDAARKAGLLVVLLALGELPARAEAVGCVEDAHTHVVTCPGPVFTLTLDQRDAALAELDICRVESKAKDDKLDASHVRTAALESGPSTSGYLLPAAIGFVGGVVFTVAIVVVSRAPKN